MNDGVGLHESDYVRHLDAFCKTRIAGQARIHENKAQRLKLKEIERERALHDVAYKSLEGTDTHKAYIKAMVETKDAIKSNDKSRIEKAKEAEKKLKAEVDQLLKGEKAHANENDTLLRSIRHQREFSQSITTILAEMANISGSGHSTEGSESHNNESTYHAAA